MMKLTQQSRTRTGMVYDFRCDGSRLMVRIFPRESEADSGDWRVEARTSNAPEAMVVCRLRTAENAWLATRWPLWKTSTVALVMRASTVSRISFDGTE